MSAVFTPPGPISGRLGGQMAKKLFDLVEGAIARLVRGMIDHGVRHGWLRLTGAWPGEERPEEES